MLTAIPPPALPVRDEGDGTADEAASDPPSPTTVQGDEGGEKKEDQEALEGDLAGDELDILLLTRIWSSGLSREVWKAQPIPLKLSLQRLELVRSMAMVM